MATKIGRTNTKKEKKLQDRLDIKRKRIRIPIQTVDKERNQ